MNPHVRRAPPRESTPCSNRVCASKPDQTFYYARVQKNIDQQTLLSKTKIGREAKSDHDIIGFQTGHSMCYCPNILE